MVTITRFVPDPRKEGGEYATLTAALKRISQSDQALFLIDGQMIPLDQIYEIDSELLREMEE